MALEETGIEFVAEGANEFEGAINDAASALDDFEATGNETADAFGGFEDVVTGALMRVGEIAIETAMAAGTALVDFAKDSFASALDAEKGMNRLRGAIQRAGDAAPVTEQQALDLAESLKGLAGGSDDAVIAAEATLLKFQQIGEETFPKALETSLNLAAILGIDVASAAEQLGRALANPESATRLLRQAGIVLTDAEKEQIKTFMDAGMAAEVQTFVLEKLATTTAGAAESMAGTIGGQMTIFKETIAEAGETIATAFLPLLQTLMDQYLKPLIPVFENIVSVISGRLSSALGDVTIDFDAILEVIDPIVDALQDLFNEFKKSAPQMKALGQELFGFLQSEMGITLPALIENLVSIIRSLTEIWREHGDEIMAVIGFTFKILVATIGGAMTIITGVVDAALQLISGALNFWSKIFSGDFAGAFNVLVETLRGIFNTIMNMIGTFIGQSTAVITQGMQDSINDFVFGLTGSLQGAIIEAINNVRGFFGFMQLGFDIVNGIAEGIRNAAFLVWSALWDVVNDAINNVRNLLGIGSPSRVAGEKLGTPIGEGVAESILGTLNQVIEAMSAITTGAMSAVSPAASASQIMNVSNSRSYSPSWNLNVNSSQSSQGLASDFSILQAMSG